MRVLGSYLVFPALMVGPSVAGWYAWTHGVPELAILAGGLVGCLAVQRVLERVMPYRRDWNARRRTGENLVCMALGAITQQLVELSVLAATYLVASELSAALGSTSWPASWPLVAQVVLVILVADLGHYAAHRALHEHAWLWRFHQMHHTPHSLDSLNFFRMHPVDIVLKSVANTVPLILLGAPAAALLPWMIMSGISAGSLNHANVEMRTGWLDTIFSTPRLHRFHHSRRRDEHRCNLGNITVIYDRLFGTYCAPARRSVDEVGEPGGARSLVIDLLEPFVRRP